MPSISVSASTCLNNAEAMPRRLALACGEYRYVSWQALMGPILRQISLGPHPESGAIGGHSALEQFARFFSGAACPEVYKR